MRFERPSRATLVGWRALRHCSCTRVHACPSLKAWFNAHSECLSDLRRLFGTILIRMIPGMTSDISCFRLYHTDMCSSLIGQDTARAGAPKKTNAPHRAPLTKLEALAVRLLRPSEGACFRKTPGSLSMIHAMVLSPAPTSQLGISKMRNPRFLEILKSCCLGFLQNLVAF